MPPAGAAPTLLPSVHGILCELLALGLGLAEAKRIGIEELCCLLTEKRLRDELSELDREARRIASLSFANTEKQERALLKLSMQARRALELHQREV